VKIEKLEMFIKCWFVVIGIYALLVMTLIGTAVWVVIKLVGEYVP
jgi:hypothetical protein